MKNNLLERHPATWTYPAAAAASSEQKPRFLLRATTLVTCSPMARFHTSFPSAAAADPEHMKPVSRASSPRDGDSPQSRGQSPGARQRFILADQARNALKQLARVADEQLEHPRADD